MSTARSHRCWPQVKPWGFWAKSWQLCSGIRTRAGKSLDRGTGLSLSAVKLAVRSLEKRGLITVQRVKEENGYNFVNVYSLRFQEREVGQKMAYSRAEND